MTLSARRLLLYTCFLSQLATLCVAEIRPPLVKTLEDKGIAEKADTIEASVPIEALPGFSVSLWASEDFLGDPVGIDMDDYGRAHVGVTIRRRSSKFDIRGFPAWVAPSWSWTSVQDRIEFLHEELSPENSDRNSFITDFNQDGFHDWRDLAVQEDTVFLLEDTSNDGRADTSTQFHLGFNSEETDIIGTVLYNEGDLYVGVAPDVWRVVDSDEDGAWDSKESISSGYGIHIGFGGHGISGMKLGPDGRLYWGIGDVGFSTTDLDGKTWDYPRQGVLVRSELDGTGFEVVAHGLRNVHEFDWDQYGNIIGVDNDGDHAGETERIVYLIDGSDTGWRNNWQLGKYADPKNNAYKIWMDEDYYKPRNAKQSAHLLPPIAPYDAGPAGMVFNPGTALSPEWKNFFFVASFTGSAANSSIGAFTLKPAGASFEVAEKKKIMSGITSVGIDFGPDGALYLADWNEGWDTDEIGRIWKLDIPVNSNAPARSETRRRLVESFENFAAPELLDLMGHPDRRIRLKAQFECVRRKDADTLLENAENSDNRLARIHAIWGLSQLARAEVIESTLIHAFLDDPEAEIQAQSAKMLGDLRDDSATEALIALLDSDQARVQLLTAEALGRIGNEEAFPRIVEMLAENNDKDVYLRQAGAIAISRIENPSTIATLALHESDAVRIAAVIALGRAQSPLLANFLSDENEYIVLNAARAILDDELVPGAIPALAAKLGSINSRNEAFTRRVLNANFFEGTQESAYRLAAFASSSEADLELRIESLDTLAYWSSPSVYDRVSGRVREDPKNEPTFAQMALARHYANLVTDPLPEVRSAAIHAIGQNNLVDFAENLHLQFTGEQNAKVRISILRALTELEYPNISDVLFAALQSRDAPLVMEALDSLSGLGLSNEETASLLQSVLENGEIPEQQAAIKVLGDLGTPESVSVLENLFVQYESGSLAPEIQLDLVEAIGRSGDNELLEKAKSHQASKPQDQPLRLYSEALYGGDPVAGERIFHQEPAAQCIRCHALGESGGNVGPNLSSIGAVLSREQLLEALVDPSARIATGYGIETITTADGQSYTGIVAKEDENSITLAPAGQTINKDNLLQRVPSVSSMPPMDSILSKSQIRDLVAYLSTLRGH